MRLSGILTFFAFAAILLLINCSEEPDFNFPPNLENSQFSPFLSFQTGDGLENDDLRLAPKDTIKVQFIGESNDMNDSNSPLKEFRLLVNEELWTPGFHKVNLNDQELTENPIAIPSINKDSINWTMEIFLPDSSGIFSYAFLVEAENGEVARIEIEVTTNVLPSIIINGESNYELIPNSILTLPVEISSGDSQLLKFGVVEDDAFVEPERLSLDGVTFTENPINLMMDNQEGFIGNLEIEVQSREKISNYIVSIGDTLNHTFFSNFSIDSRILTPTQPEEVLMYEFDLDTLISNENELLQAVDLDKRQNTTSNDTSAEIRDDGQDQNQVWKKSFRAINNSIARALPDDVVPAGFFENVVFEAELARTWPDAIKFEAFTIDTFFVDTTFTTLKVPISDPLKVKDMFLVNKNDKYHLLRVKAIIEDENLRNHVIFEIKN